MRLKLSVRLADRVEDLAITADANATIGEIASAIVAADPARGGARQGAALTLRIDDRDQRVVPAATALADAGVMSGQTVAVVSDAGATGYSRSTGAAAASLVVVSGPDAGQTFPLRAGANQVGRGRGNDVALTDPLVSKSHLRVNVGEQIDIADLGSANGVVLRGGHVTRAVLGADDVVAIGDTCLRVALHHAGHAAGGPYVAFNRSPTLDPEHAGAKLEAPSPPQRPDRTRLPIIPMFAPLLMGVVLFLITRNPTSVAFVALSPVMMIGTYVENRTSGKKRFAEDVKQFQADLRDLEVQMHRALEEEGIGRRREFPPTQAVLAAVAGREPLLWSRRPDKRAFLELRLGLGVQPARLEVDAHGDKETTPQLRRELNETLARYAYVPDVPVVAVLSTCASVGVAGPRDAANEVAASLVMQVAGLHSPAEVVLAALVAPAHAREWEWLKWLPHTTSDHSPLAGEHVAVSSSGQLVQQLEDLVNARSVDHHDGVASLPAVVVLVDDAAAFERDRVVQIAERGARAGVHLVWLAAATPLLPAVCRTFIEVEPATGAWSVGDVRDATRVVQVAADRCPLGAGETAARQLAPLIDAGVPVSDDTSVPRRVALLDLVDAELAASSAAIVDQWRASNSLPVEPAPDGQVQPRRTDNTLRAFVGATAGDPFVLDLREHGPHALVGGTTGAGKSEFLQTWVLGMAAAHSPSRVNFLFVDYKGGAAFAECIHLPHCVGMVTDLSPYLVRRALVSLKAELKYREELLHRNGKAKDLLELEQSAPWVAPPSLVIIVDEFAALVKEVPGFVDGVVDVAQRGRSLGLHLILATQRPAGVIRDNLRANTNLRVALRMADEDDSHDVVGTKVAASFDPSIPGRGIAKLGPGRLTTFQTGYVGGWTTDETPPPVILVDELRLGGGARWEPPVVAVVAKDPGPNDLKRIVSTIRQAAMDATIPAPRKPWQPELAEAYELARIRPSRNDGELMFGTLDNPAEQRQELAAFWPDRDGNMAVYGTGGSGKSAFLRTLAVAAGLSSEHPCHVYALDFGGRGLAMLEPLPHVGAVIAGDDTERTDRLIRMLRDIAAERSERYAAASNAASISQYRMAANAPAEPRILVLIDNFGALRQAMETSQRQVGYDTLQRLIADGRALGIHFVMTADRAAVIPPAVMASVQRRLVLRLAQDGEYPVMGVPNGQLSSESPPGRGSLEGAEVQVAILGGVPSTARQSAAMLRLAGELAGVARWPAAPGVPRLPDEVRLAELPVAVDGLPVLGLADDTMAPVGFEVEDAFLLIGPPQARPEQALLAMVQSFQRWRPGATTGVLSLRRSSLANAQPWDTTVTGADEIREYLAALNAGDAVAPALLAVDGVVDLSNSDVDFELQTLLKTVVNGGTFLVGLGDAFQIGSAFGSAKIFKGYRNGLALLPEQMDGDMAFGTPFPRVARTDFRANCGYLVRQGRVRKVLVASPS